MSLTVQGVRVQLAGRASGGDWYAVLEGAGLVRLPPRLVRRAMVQEARAQKKVTAILSGR